MKPNRKNPYFNRLFLSNSLASVVVSLSLLPSLHAANENRFWDGGAANIAGTGNGVSLGTAGNWNTTLTNWDKGAVAYVAWVNANNDYANFGGTAGTVTLTSPVTANALTFTTTGYTIAGTSPNILSFAGGGATITTSALASGSTTTISAIIAGSPTGNLLTIASNGDMTASGGGNTGKGVILSGVNTFTANIKITSGFLTTGTADSNFGAAANTIQLDGGGLLGDVTKTISRAISITANGGTARVYGSATLTLSGVVSGAGTLTKTDSGTLTLSNAANTRTGPISVAGGILSIAAAGNLGTSAASLSFPTAGAGLTITGTAVALANNVSLGAVTGNINLDTPNSSSTIFNGTVSGGGASTVWFLRGGASGQNSGAITLNGNNTGLLGTLNVQRGPLILGNANAAGSTSITLDSNKNPNGALQFSGSFTIANNVLINSGTTQPIGVSTGLSANISGVISSAAGQGIEKVGAGQLTLSNNNTYSGATTVSAGILSLDYGTQDNSKLADAAVLTLAGGTLDITSTSATTHVEVVGSTTVTANSSITRSGSSANKIDLGAITNSAGVLNIAGDNIATTTNALANGLLPGFITVNGGLATKDGSNNILAYTGYTDVNRLGGTIADGAGSNVRIIEAGASGSVTLAAAGTTNMGTLFNAGTIASTLVDIGSGNILRFNDIGSILAGTNGLTINNGILTAGGIDNTAGTVDVFNASATATTIGSVIADNGSGVVGLAKSGAGVLILSGVNTHTGASTVNLGTLALSGGNAIPDAATVTLSNNAGVALRLDASETIGTISASGTNSTINLQANALTLGDASSFTIPSPITGTGGSLVKQGAGTLTLTGINTYSGGTTLSVGALTATVNTTAQNALGTGAASLAMGTTLTLNNTNITATTPVIANTFTGTGLLKLQFAANTTARNTTLSGTAGFGGTIQLSNLGATGDKWSLSGLTTSAALAIDSGSQLYLFTTPSTFSGGITVSGTGNSEIRGAIRINTTLGGNITLGGDATVGPEGTATFLGNVTSSAATPVLLTVGTTNSAGNSIFSGVISDGASSVVSVTKATGTSTMTLSGVNTYSGATAINAGTLNLTGSIASSALTMAATTTLRGEGTTASLTTAGVSNLVINPATQPGAFTTGAISLGGTMTVSFEGGAPSLGSFRVLNYTGTDPLNTSFALANSASYRNPQFTAAAGEVNLILGNTTLTWTGTGGTNWDVNTTSNWNDTTPAASKFFYGDAVVFDDSPSGTAQTVALTVAVQPASITFNNTSDTYALTGTAGAIIGSTGITKNGTANVTLAGGTGQNYTGAIAVNTGSLTMGSATAFGQTSGITIASGATVNINDQTPGTVATGGYTYTIAGTGIASTGAINNTPVTATNIASNAGVKSLFLTADASIGGTSRFDIGFANVAGTGTINGGGYILTKVGVNLINARGPATNISYVVSEGTLGFETTAASSGANPITVNGLGKVVVVGALTIPNNVTVAAGATIGSLNTANGNWSGSLSLATGSIVDTPVDLFVSGTATNELGGSLTKTGAGQLVITGSLVGSGNTLNQNAGTVQIGNVGATGSFSGFTTVNLGNGVLFRNRLTTVNNSISSNFTFANASAEVRQHGALTTDTLTLTGTVGTNTANGILRATFGKIVLGSGASSAVNMVAAQGAPASGRGMIEVQTGASLTSPWFNIGQDGSNSGILNVTGGTVTALTGGSGGNNAVRIGHWNNGSTTIPSELNVSAGTFDASATNLTTSIGWDGYGIMTVGGGANPATAKVFGILLDANGDSSTYNDTVTLLPNGTLEVGLGGNSSASANDYFIFSGGTIKGVANSTWAARMDVTAATTSFASVNSGIVVNQTGTLTGTGILEKTGPGLLQATGGAFAGTLTSSGGTLHLGTTAWTAATVSSSAGGVIQPGTSSAAGASTIPTLTLNGGSPTFRANFNNGNFGDRFLVTGTDAFTVASPTALTVIPGIDLFVGDKIPLIDYNGTIGGAVGFAGLSATAAGNPHYSLSLEDDTVNTIVKVSIDGLDSIIWKGNENGNWDVNTASNWQTVSDNATSKFYSLDAVKFTDDGAITPAVTLVGTIQPSSVTFDSSFDYTLSGSPIIGSGGFVKNNIGKVTLLNNNTNTGTTVINSGSVVVGNGTTIGALGGSGDITVGGTASLELSRSDAQTLTRKVINGGTLIKSGAGTLTMSSNNNVCDIIVNGGTFAARGGDWANSFAANRTITVNAPGILDTTTHALGGLGGATRPNNIVINEDGIWKLNNEQQLPNTALTLTAGIVNGPGEMRGGGTIATIAHATKSSAINAPINNGNGAVTFNVDDGGVAVDLSVTGNLVGVNTYTKIGIGTMVTTGNNSYTGGTNANGGILEVSSVADAGGVGSIGVYTSGIPGYLGIANDGTFRYTGTGSQTSARNLWIDTGAQNKTIEVTSATGDITFSGTGGNINKPFTKTGAGALTLADVINVGATVTVNGGRLSLTGANAYTGDTAVLAGTLAVNGTAIANTNKLIIDGGKVEPTGTEVVDTLYFGGVQQIAGTWGATGSGATNIDDVRFAGTAGVISVTTGPAGYVTWAGLKGLTSGNNGVSQDPDNDGINNLQEFYFDGDPLANNQAILPQLSSDATYMILTFKRRDDAETDIISQNAQWGSDLIGWTPATITEASAAADANGVIINVVENGTAPDDVTVSIPRANAIGFKLFGRVVIVK
jgi:autotransporter-associated beta strand protein